LPDAAYYREWRKAHPEYRKKQNLLRRERRKRKGREDRSEEYKRRGKTYLARASEKHVQERLQATGDNGWCLESSLIRKAKELALRVKKPDLRTTVYDDTYEELVCVCVLALCEGNDPEEAMKAWMTERSTRTRMGAPLYDQGL